MQTTPHTEASAAATYNECGMNYMHDRGAQSEAWLGQLVATELYSLKISEIAAWYHQI
jgi:hypothetical protein